MNDSAKFVLKFLAILITCYLIIAWHSVNDHVIVPYTVFVTRAAAAVMNVFGADVTTSGTIISASRFGVDVNNGCNGVEAALILVAAMGAFPVSMKKRILGVLAGLAFIQVINILRLGTLVWIGQHHPRVFNLIHVFVWQIVIILATVIFFLFWSARIARPAGATAR